jgi:predicted outer membrane protein
VSGTRMIIGGLAAAAVVAACASRQEAPPVQRASLPKPRPAVPALSPADYVASAGAIDLYVIKASELALRRSTTRKVQDVATRLISAHQGSSAQLSFGGRRLNLLPSAEMQPGYQALVDRLAATADFDRDYALQMRAVHQQAIALHSNYAAFGSSPTLVPIAKALAPVMEQQGRLISYL